MSAKDQQSNPKPPRWLDKLLERFCAPELLEEVMGDLHERYHHRTQRWGETEARNHYLREVLSFVRPSIFKRKNYNNLKSMF